MQHYGAADMAMMDGWTPGGMTPMMEGMGMEYGLPHSASFGAPIDHCQQIVSDAIDTAPNLHGKVQELNQRVQKLERTRGQISKDMADMIGELKDIARQAGVEPSAALRKAMSSQPRHVTVEAPTLPEDAGGAPARKSARAKTVPASPLAAVAELRLLDASRISGLKVCWSVTWPNRSSSRRAFAASIWALRLAAHSAAFAAVAALFGAAVQVRGEVFPFVTVCPLSCAVGFS